ncbi:23S rRNA (guanosine(2251)-2'-O)-methyltransferase RlmB [Alkalilimnicola sp. S0819]|uniref:23S rRNA (guanosine(2251)-2'-O)-methyltransferase RlmB n=1 Tax=Alkalilimnicola sp. S0819 TaxID=2613922 RepID=UPI0012620B82|nr:23S rRNA (guanosine(2251)-2'-O)-methyltransferase RlmB [Alkalilimnicola sp. S0819]KAB7628361.1 23S rRNA (guanosine(2251)-2'-O)-methyltransferase RlmB [Alkalilimnicola sp. S0819]MPQ15262.1 23S rRNA (guanosine(2251)-2'-O)-methyltransferase RlmB [Alkalilimnicola sp. S0819]
MSEPQYIHGLHAARAAIKYDPAHIVEVWVEKGRRDARLERLLEGLQHGRVPLHRVARSELDRLVPGGVHQGIVLAYRGAAPRGEAELEHLLDALVEAPFLLVLDQVQDPHNLGACLRSADAAGVHGVIAPRDRAAGLTPTVHKVASGAAQSVPFFQVTNLARTLRALRERGIWLVGAAGEGDASLYQADLTGPLAVLMGAEESGLRRLSRELCDQLASIPMAGQVESLNVSVAAGVFLFEAVRQRRALRR